MVEFSADAYTHRKQVGVRQSYNQVPQTAWVSHFEFQLQLGDKMPVWESAPDRGLGPSVTHGWAAQLEQGRSAAMIRRICGSQSLFLTHLSHINPFGTTCERYIFIKKCVHSFFEVVSMLTMFPLIFVYVYVCGYTTDIATWVQILTEAVCISHSANTLEKGLNPTVLPPAMDK